jgi:uncharacterized membrane protein YdjX (TVP38/TMEM64 family)
LLAFAIPPIPNDILIYVAGLSEIRGRRFLVANFIGRLPMVALFALVGANGLDITPGMTIGLAVMSVLMLAAWWYAVRERPDRAAAEVSILAVITKAL